MSIEVVEMNLTSQPVLPGCFCTASLTGKRGFAIVAQSLNLIFSPGRTRNPLVLIFISIPPMLRAVSAAHRTYHGFHAGVIGPRYQLRKEEKFAIRATSRCWIQDALGLLRNSSLRLRHSSRAMQDKSTHQISSRAQAL